MWCCVIFMHPPKSKILSILWLDSKVIIIIINLAEIIFQTTICISYAIHHCNVSMMIILRIWTNYFIYPVTYTWEKQQFGQICLCWRFRLKYLVVDRRKHLVPSRTCMHITIQVRGAIPVPCYTVAPHGGSRIDWPPSEKAAGIQRTEVESFPVNVFIPLLRSIVHFRV